MFLCFHSSWVWVPQCYSWSVHRSIIGLQCSFFSLQQLLKMREELKQREAELEKSLEDKQQLENQVQNLKDGLQYLQNTHVMQVRFTGSTVLSSGFPENEERMLIWSVFCGCVLKQSKFVVYSLVERGDLICTLIRKKLVQDESWHVKDIEEINLQ